MNHKIKRKWIAALRSGYYQQCYGQIEDGDKRCAGGVLVEVMRETTGDYAISSLGMNMSTYYRMKYDVIDMNDNQRKTFPEIADWIEENIP